MSSPAAIEVAALGERRALRAFAGDAVDLAGEGDPVVLGGLDGQRGDDDRVVRFAGVVEVDQLLDRHRRPGRRSRVGRSAASCRRNRTGRRRWYRSGRMPHWTISPPPAGARRFGARRLRARRFGAGDVVSRGRSGSLGESRRAPPPGPSPRRRGVIVIVASVVTPPVHDGPDYPVIVGADTLTRPSCHAQRPQARRHRSPQRPRRPRDRRDGVPAASARPARR